MKLILPAFLLVVSPLAFAQAINPPACDDLKGLEKEACLKKGGTVKANTAGSGSSTAPKPSEQPRPAPDREKDHAKPDDKKPESK